MCCSMLWCAVLCVSFFLMGFSTNLTSHPAANLMPAKTNLLLVKLNPGFSVMFCLFWVFFKKKKKCRAIRSSEALFFWFMKGKKREVVEALCSESQLKGILWMIYPDVEKDRRNAECSLLRKRKKQMEDGLSCISNGPNCTIRPDRECVSSPLYWSLMHIWFYPLSQPWEYFFIYFYLE